MQEWSHLLWQHPLKEASLGLPIVLLPLLLYTDDVRGNLTRKWNGFDVWYLLLGGLTWKENVQFRNIHFLTYSNNANAMDMSEPIVQDLERLENEGIVAYDGHLQREVNLFLNFYVLDTVNEETSCCLPLATGACHCTSPMWNM